jgi:hypothetical protein
MNWNMSIDTTIQFAYGHGILDEKNWEKFEKECCQGCIGNLFLKINLLFKKII